MEEGEKSNTLFRIGGFSGSILGVAYIVITIIYLKVGALTGTPAHQLEQIAENENLWWWILSLSVFTDLLFIPILWALYKKLKTVNVSLTVTGVLLIGIFVVFDLLITWPSYCELISCSKQFSLSSDEKLRDYILIETSRSHENISSKLFAIYAILIPALGIWVFGLLMRQSKFSKATSWTGILTGIFGTVTVIGSFFLDSLETAVILTSLFTTIWILMAGKDLLKLSK